MSILVAQMHDSRILIMTFGHTDRFFFRVPSEAAGDVADYLHLVLHGEVELLRDLSLPPHLGGARLGVELVLHCSRFEPFHSVIVQPHEF